MVLVYGGDNGLETPAVVQHVLAHMDLGYIFMRELSGEVGELFPASVFPPACFQSPHWAVTESARAQARA